jgi:hypothetical protein
MADPNSLTLDQLILQAKQRSDLVNSNFITTEEWTYYVNASYLELYDLLVTCYEDYFAVLPPPTYNFTGLTDTYPLPNDCYKVLGVDLSLAAQVGGPTDAWLTLSKYNFSDRNKYVYGNTPLTYLGVLNLRYRILDNSIRFIPLPAGSQSWRLWYVPFPQPLVVGTDVPATPGQWNEYIVTDAAIRAMQKEESDVTVLAQQKSELIKRINGSAVNRDAGFPDTVSDTQKMNRAYGSYGSDGPNGGM